MGSKKPKMEVTEYYLSAHFGICAGPVDALHSMTIGEKPVWFGKARTATPISVNRPELFGGVKKEGGVGGIAHYLPGDSLQVLPENLAAKLGLTSATCPAYRGITSVFLHGGDRGFYWTANSPYLKGLWTKVSRTPVGLNPANAMIARGIASNVSVYFLLDRSLSLSGAQFETIKDAVRSSLDQLETHITSNPGVRVDIGVRFYSNGSSGIERTNCNVSDINSIRAFISGANRVTGGDVFSAMGHVESWFQATKAVKLDKRVLVFVTDTETEDSMVAAAAGPAADMLDQNGGDFQIAKGTAVDMYAINYISTDIQYTGLLDNTPEDGVPVISADDQNGLTDAVAAGLRGRDFDANPAHIIYECLTNTDWGMGSPEYRLNVESFKKAAATLYAEKLGLSFLWAQQSTVEDFVTTVINHIEATLYVDPRSGLFTLKLIRDDYDVDDLPEITPAIATLENFQRKLWGETINEISVAWRNPENEQNETVIAQDLANIAMQGGIVSDSKTYEGVRSSDLAMKLAMRDLRVASSPLISCEVSVNRKGWYITPGDVVLLTWPEHEVHELPMRVGPVDYGRTTDSRIKLSLVEDVFGLPAGDYTPPPDSEWLPTSEEPRPIEWSLLFTAPYYSLVNAGADVTSIPDTDVVPAVLGAQTGLDTYGFRVNEDGVDGAELNLTARATILDALTFESTSVVDVSALSLGSGAREGTLAVLGTTDEDMEMCLVVSRIGNTLTLNRGVLDTTPKEWDAGTPIWFLNDEDTFSPQETQTIGAPVDYQLVTLTSLGALDLDSASTASGTMTARPWLPFRPANVQVEGVAHGSVDADGLSSVMVTWARRNRLMEDTVVLSWDDADVEPEDGQTTTVAVYTLDGTLITTHDDLPGTSFELPASSFSPHSAGVVRVTSKIEGQESIQGHGITVVISGGYGYGYGYNYGGV